MLRLSSANANLLLVLDSRENTSGLEFSYTRGLTPIRSYGRYKMRTMLSLILSKPHSYVSCDLAISLRWLRNKWVKSIFPNTLTLTMKVKLGTVYVSGVVGRSLGPCRRQFNSGGKFLL